MSLRAVNDSNEDTKTLHPFNDVGDFMNFAVAGWLVIAQKSRESSRSGDSSPISTNRPSWILWNNLAGTGGKQLLSSTGRALLSELLACLLVVAGENASTIRPFEVYAGAEDHLAVGLKLKAGNG